MLGGGAIDTQALIAAAKANASAAQASGGFGMGMGMGSSGVNQATRTARRLYIGGLTVATEPALTAFFNELIAAVYKPGDHLVGVFLSPEKRFAFIEFKEVAMCTAALAFDGVLFNGAQLKIKRPNDYVPAPVTGPPIVFRMGGVGLVSSSVPDGPNKIFIGGLPHTLTDEQVKELLTAFGPLVGFHLVREAGSPTSKGYAFAEWANPAHGEMAVQGLHGMLIADKPLTVKRAAAAQAALERAQQASAIGGGSGALGLGPGIAPGMMGLSGSLPPMAALAAAAVNPLASAVGAAGGFGSMPYQLQQSYPPPPVLPPPPPPPAAVGPSNASHAPRPPTRVLRLSNMVTAADVADAAEHADIVADIREELSKFGTLTAIAVPRAGPLVGFVYVEFGSEASAAAAAAAMGGRTFASRRVAADFEDPSFLVTTAHLLK